jgi:hypothetical protein
MLNIASDLQPRRTGIEIVASRHNSKLICAMEKRLNDQAVPTVDRMTDLTQEFELLRKQFFDLEALYRNLNIISRQ